MFKGIGRLHLHFAAPCEGGDQLIRTLRSVRSRFAPSDITIPDPLAYRQVITRKALGEMGGYFTPLEEEGLARNIDDSSELLILSFDRLFGSPAANFSGGPIYLQAGARIEFIRSLFPNREVSLFFSAVNPGTVMARLMMGRAGDLLPEAPKERPLWSEMVERVQSDHIDLPVCIWATEEIPVCWPMVLKAVLGDDADMPHPGSLHPAAKLLCDVGRREMLKELQSMPPVTDRQLAEFLGRFLAEHVDEKDITFDIDLPGWDQATIQDFELLYEQDVDACADIPGNSVITLGNAFEPLSLTA